MKSRSLPFLARLTLCARKRGRALQRSTRNIVVDRIFAFDRRVTLIKRDTRAFPPSRCRSPINRTIVGRDPPILNRASWPRFTGQSLSRTQSSFRCILFAANKRGRFRPWSFARDYRLKVRSDVTLRSRTPRSI